jgi:short-subunit dehydrogenase
VGGSLLDTSAEDYEQQMRSCYFSSVYMTRGLAAAIPSARIINIISSSALQAHKNNSAYGAAKSAQMHFFQSLQEELDPQKYQITNLYPYNLASHGPDEYAINALDLATYVYDLASTKSSYYLRDVTIFPSKA